MSGTSTAPPVATSSTRATPQGGILEGGDPSVYNLNDPIIIFIIQAGIIIIFCRLLHWPLSYIRQPRVIAEVIGGILLGPTVLGRIDGFTDTIFPKEAMPNLALVANLGLVLFLFLVGLEVDLRVLVKNWRVAASVGVAGMLVPFGLGCGIAWGLYHEFKNEPNTKPISFGIFMLFIGVAMAITAFPVLCRILVELKLLLTPVGIITLSAGVGNDVVGWILLALCVALVNASSGLAALWVLLTTVGFILFLTYGVRPLFLKVLHRTNSIQNGPGQGVVALTLLIALASAFFTGVIGIHPIFGAFVAGLICPHEGGFAIKLTEKIEDLVTTIFLPLYFTLSGLKTNIGLLDNGITWGYVIGVIVVAFTGKLFPAAIAARYSGLVWRESFTIGSLMSCKGLVELIVLNIGLQAQILSTRTFTIFVVMALVTTFATTPLTSYLYPPEYQKKIEAWKRGEIDWDTGKPTSTTEDGSDTLEKLSSYKLSRVLFHLRLDGMPGLLAFAALLGGSPTDSGRLHPSHARPEAEDDGEVSSVDLPKKPIRAHGMRLIELTERESSWMQVSEMDDYTAHDPVVNTFRTLGQLHNLTVSGEVAVIPDSSFADTLTSRAEKIGSDYLFLPWSETGSMSESQVISSENALGNNLISGSYNSFVSQALRTAPCNVAVFVNNGFGGTSRRRDKTSQSRRPGLFRHRSTHSMVSVDENFADADPPPADRSHHLFCPFYGGEDDRAAMRLALQLAENPFVTATLVHIEAGEDYHAHSSATGSTPISAEGESAFFAALRNSIPAELAGRVVFATVSASSAMSAGGAVDAALKRIRDEVGQRPRNAGDLVIAGRNASRTAALQSPTSQIKASEDPSSPTTPGGTLKDTDASGSLGALAAAVVGSGVRASQVVVQALTSGAKD